MQYHLNEGSFSLAGNDWLDNSMNVLRDDANGITVIVSRGPIPEDSDFEQEFHRQWDSMRSQMTKLQQSEFTRVSVGARQHIRGVEVSSQFERNGQMLCQHQLAVQAEGKAVLMVFTYSALRQFSEGDQTRWDALKSTLNLQPGQDA
ncbi:DcrB-related protein [Pantoea sp. CCBC3-3-1]|uniref:DcrB-related protein n=1 Tax=Pantoea sp. CCBC3-3-1 TaxID=2490851 RepID=UPI0011BE8AE2|nr:DcrB-related protein [Pantoea sp. CCBC3-3-1]